MKPILATLALMLLAVSAFAQTAPRRIKGLRRPQPNTERALVQAALKELREGAVVVVEDTRTPLLPRWPVRNGLFRLTRPVPSLAPAPWMDTSKVVSGGNPVGLLVPLGWEFE